MKKPDLEAPAQTKHPRLVEEVFAEFFSNLREANILGRKQLESLTDLFAKDPAPKADSIRKALFEGDKV